MAKKVKFPLMLHGDRAVRTLEELRDHFDFASVLGYYENGRLVEWLSVWYYDDEAEEVKKLDAKSSDFKNRLCDILGVPFPGEMAENVSMTYVAQKNERLEQLKKITADDKILAAVDNVAFTQEELENLLGNGIEEVYLCGEQFAIPCSKLTNHGCLKFIGLNMPVVNLVNDVEHTSPHIDMGTFSSTHDIFENVEFDADSIVALAKNMPSSRDAIMFWEDVANKGTARTQYSLGYVYWHGAGLGRDRKKAVKWFRKAAEQGHYKAQFCLGVAYEFGMGLEKDMKEALTWYHKSADLGYSEAQYQLGEAYWHVHKYGLDEDRKEAVKWYRKAAEQDHKPSIAKLFEVGENLMDLG